jgi:hypothetical protein
MLRYLLLALLVTTTTGCARFIDGAIHDMTIQTVNADGATCFIENEDLRYKIYAPQTIKMTGTNKPLNIRCLAPGNREKTVIVEPNINKTAYWNALNGFVGMLYDYDANALYEFPKLIVVDFSDMAPQPMPVPHYDRMLKDYNYMRGYEEFRPGMPALLSDMDQQVHKLEPRRTDDAVTSGVGGKADLKPMVVND